VLCGNIPTRLEGPLGLCRNLLEAKPDSHTHRAGYRCTLHQLQAVREYYASTLLTPKAEVVAQVTLPNRREANLTTVSPDLPRALLVWISPPIPPFTGYVHGAHALAKEVSYPTSSIVVGS